MSVKTCCRVTNEERTKPLNAEAQTLWGLKKYGAPSGCTVRSQMLGVSYNKTFCRWNYDDIDHARTLSNQFLGLIHRSLGTLSLCRRKEGGEAFQ